MMKLRNLDYLLLFISLVFVCPQNSLFANSLRGEFVFNKRAPQIALVYFTEDKGLPKAELTIDQVDKEFVPKLTVAAKGSTIAIKNSDAIFHNIYIRDRKLDLHYDTGLLKPQSIAYKEIDWAENQVVKISCNIHPKMKAWVACTSSRYHKAVVFENKENTAKFEIKSVPDGLTKVAVWLLGYPPIKVVMEKGKPQQIELKKRKNVLGTLTLDLTTEDSKPKTPKSETPKSEAPKSETPKSEDSE